MAVSAGVLLWGALRKPVSAGPEGLPDASHGFFRDQLEGIDRDVATGRLSEEEAVAARAELAREVIRFEKENAVAAPARSGHMAVLAAVPVIAVATIGLYVWIGRSDLPAQPLAGRELPEAAPISLDAAVAQVEARMVDTPNDIRGWLALGPIYMEQGRFNEAVNAYRRVLDLEPPTADRQTNLAEALIMASEGAVPEDAMEMLRNAVASDPVHVRSRFYLAGELTRQEEFTEAIALWEELLGLASGEEPWVDTARAGLIAAQAGLGSTTLNQSEPDATMDVMIRGMVEGLAARLADTGGSAEEWMQLVRSRLALDGPEAARADLERGLAALSGQDRLALENFAGTLALTEEQ